MAGGRSRGIASRSEEDPWGGRHIGHVAVTALALWVVLAVSLGAIAAQAQAPTPDVTRAMPSTVPSD